MCDQIQPFDDEDTFIVRFVKGKRESDAEKGELEMSARESKRCLQANKENNNEH